MSAETSHHKTELHNRLGSLGWPSPVYDYGLNGNVWLCVVRINGGEFSRADGPSRSAASELAAKRACARLTQEGYPQRLR
ncbi:hypothetical protein HDZ31DRAFT_61282 [Schizophyllum fasciatum]